MRSGLALDQTWHEIDHIDDLLEAKISYAWHDQYGYLTACPTNVGTGMRASVMVHLPALGLTRQLEKVFRSLQKINLVVRGLYGEGSRASGDFFQISNQITLGRSETTALSELQGVIAKILSYERQARAALLQEKRLELQDRVSRALGALQHATMMTSDETMELLSSVRMGINLGLLDDISMQTVNELFIQTQPSHLQKLVGGPLDGEERNAARARHLRTRLRQSV
jgi:protein arginine kinase